MRFQGRITGPGPWVNGVGHQPMVRFLAAVGEGEGGRRHSSLSALCSVPFASLSETPSASPTVAFWSPFGRKRQETPLYVVVAQVWLTLQVVGLGLAHFQLPVRPPKSHSPPTREHASPRVGGARAGGQTPGRAADYFGKTARGRGGRSSKEELLTADRDLVIEPGAGVSPVIPGRARGDVQQAGGLFGGQADEIPQLYQLCFERVLRGELIEGVIDG